MVWFVPVKKTSQRYILMTITLALPTKNPDMFFPSSRATTGRDSQCQSSDWQEAAVLISCLNEWKLCNADNESKRGRLKGKRLLRNFMNALSPSPSLHECTYALATKAKSSTHIYLSSSAFGEREVVESGVGVSRSGLTTGRASGLKQWGLPSNKIGRAFRREKEASSCLVFFAAFSSPPKHTCCFFAERTSRRWW